MEEENKVIDVQVVEGNTQKKNWFSRIQEVIKKPEVAFFTGIMVVVLGTLIYNWGSENLLDSKVAVVNGEVIGERELDEASEQMAGMAFAQGIDTKDEAVQKLIRTQSLDALINTRLLMQAASASEVEVTEEEVEAEWQTLIEQYGDEDTLLAAIKEIQLSAEALREDIREQLLVDKYIRSEVDLEAVSASKEEVSNTYNTLVEAGQELPPLTDLYEAIELQIIDQKQQQLIAQLVEGLRAGAEIQTYLE